MRWVLGLILVAAACGGKTPPATTKGSAGPEPVVDPEPTAKPLLDPEAVQVWSPDKTMIATVTDLKIHLWNGKTKELLRSLDATRPDEVAFAPDGKRLYVAFAKSPPIAIDLAVDAGAPHKLALAAGIKADGNQGAAMLSVSADGTWLLGRCDTNDVCLWNTKTGAGRKWDQPPPAINVDDEVTSLVFEPGDRRIVVQNAGGSVFKLDPATLKVEVVKPGK